MNVNICLGLDDNYCQHCAAVIASILINSNPKDTYDFHLITDYISEKNIRNLEELKNIRDFELHIYTISKEEYKNIKIDNGLNISTLYRCKAMELLKCKKVLYLDCDIIVRKDIGELYKTDIKNYYCAGAEDIIGKAKVQALELKGGIYINAGVILFNLEYCRKNDVSNHIKEWLSNNETTNDQDMLNCLFDGKIKPVDITWNCMIGYMNFYDKEHFAKISEDPAIIHYITNRKPWIADENYISFRSDYFRYLAETPYYKSFYAKYKVDEDVLIMEKLKELINKVQILEGNR